MEERRADREEDARRRTWFRRPLVWLAAAVALAGIAAGAAAIVSACSEVSFQFQHRDAVSGAWVYDCTDSLQGRVNHGYYQTVFTFRGLKPGASTLEVSAPSYLPQSIPIALARGVNRLRVPLSLVGYEIPRLEQLILFERSSASDRLEVEVRPRGEDGNAVLNHPALDLRIAGRVQAQVRGGLYARSPDEPGSTLGEEL